MAQKLLPASPPPPAYRKWEVERQMRSKESQPQRDEVKPAQRDVEQRDDEADECDYGEHQDLLQLEEHRGWCVPYQPSV